MFCGEVSWKNERPLKYETIRPVSAAISVKRRPPVIRRKVQSAAMRRPQRTDLPTNNRPDATGDLVTAGHKLTTTPDNSDGEDTGKNSRRVDAWKPKAPESSGKYEDAKKNTRAVEKRNGHKMVRWKKRGPECVGGFEEDMQKTKVMEDKFKRQVVQLQQRLSLTTSGLVIPS